VGNVEFDDVSTNSLQKVIPRKNKAYRAVDVNTLNLAALLEHRHEDLVHAGLDVSKDSSSALYTGAATISTAHGASTIPAT
jgi:hypothetical protein